jgi:hypothetical protein
MLAPVVADPADDLRRGVEPGAVAGDPARHRVRGPDPHQRLGGHRSVVGQEAVELGTGAAQPVQGVEKNVVGHRISVRRRVGTNAESTTNRARKGHDQ